MANTNTTTKKEIKKIISDYEANALIADNLVKVIENKDYSSWVKHWHFINDPTELYYSVVDGLVAAYVIREEAITIKDLLGSVDFANIPAGFYLNFKEIKMCGRKLNKGSKGYPLYERKSFFKQLTKKEEETIKEDEELSILLELLYQDHSEGFQATFDVQKEDGSKYSFDEYIEWDYFKNQPAYKRHQYVLVYYYNNNDLDRPLDVQKLWKVGERKVFTKAEKVEKAETIKDSYLDRSKVKLYQGLSDKAFYRPSTHSVNLPKVEQFDNTEEYYETMFHEFSHSTGHQTLLNRKTLTAVCGFHSVTYSKEELVAELSSLFILDDLKMMTADVFKNSASYIAGWGKNFGKSIKHNIMNTLKHSLKAAELVLNKSLKTVKHKKEEIVNKEEITTNEEVKASSKVEDVAAVKVENKKSFAQLQRDLTVGVSVKTITNNVKPEKNGEVRKIAIKQTNAIAFERKEDLNKPSWLWWDKKHYSFEYVGNIFKVYSKKDNQLLFEYEILQEEKTTVEQKQEVNTIESKIDAAISADLEDKFGYKGNSIKRDYTKKEMLRKAISFHNKSVKSVTKEVLKKAIIIDDKQVVCNSAYLVMLDKEHVAPIETIKTYEEQQKENYPCLTTVIKETIDNKRLDSAKVVRALDIRQAKKNKENHFTVSVMDKLAFDPSNFETLLNFMQVKNCDEVEIFWQQGTRRPAMIKCNNQKAILCPLVWNPTWDNEEEKPTL